MPSWQRHWACRCAVGNDADLGIRAEHVRGAAAGVDDAVYLTGHSSIGAGIIAGILSARRTCRYAGEVGDRAHPTARHVTAGPLDAGDVSRGHYSSWLGDPLGGGLPGVRAVAAAAAGGDPVARAALEHVAAWLGRGTANVVNALNPEVVLLGGALEEIFAAAGATLLAEFGSPHSLRRWSRCASWPRTSVPTRR